jgi:hypothetical protein
MGNESPRALCTVQIMYSPSLTVNDPWHLAQATVDGFWPPVDACAFYAEEGIPPSDRCCTSPPNE